MQAGDKAAEFILPNQEGREVRLSDFIGKKLILYFFPKANTKGCAQEAEDFNRNLDQLRNCGAEVVGISRDTVKKQKEFHSKYELAFDLLCDAEEKVCILYDVIKEKSMYGKKYMGIERTTFILDEKGRIDKIFPKVKVKGHIEEVISYFCNKR